MSRHQADDPQPHAAVARIRDAVNDAFDAAVAEHAPDAGVALVGAITVATDGGDTLDLDTRTTVRASLEALKRAGVDVGDVSASDVVVALMGVLAEDARTAIDGAPAGNPRLN